MQLQFEKQEIPCLHTVKRETQNQEQTQELRVSDGMPDIGHIIGAWGQVILRGKEWQSDGMTVSGGTMVWVQYMPEEGGEPQCVESWMPFQMRWSFPETQHDGVILTQCFLRSVDARSISARKMMLRTNVSILGWALENRNCESYMPVDVPEDVQLRTVQYPAQLPIEAGEKSFSLEETLNLPPSMPKLEKLLSYQLQMQITEEKLMSDKVVFRGNAVLHILYRADDGGEYSWDFDLPFTQYSELDGTFGDDGEVMIIPCVTALEMNTEADQLTMKAGVVCQYRISSRPVVTVVADAYSPRRSVTPVLQELMLPSILESRTQNLHPQMNAALDGMRLTDVQFLPQPVASRMASEEAVLEIPGHFEMLYYDMNGDLHTTTQKWEQTVNMPAGEGSRIEATVFPVGKVQGNLMSGNAQLSTDLQLFTETVNGTPIPMVTALEMGELQEPDPQRPTLILRRAQGKSLWELAK